MNTNKHTQTAESATPGKEREIASDYFRKAMDAKYEANKASLATHTPTPWQKQAELYQARWMESEHRIKLLQDQKSALREAYSKIGADIKRITAERDQYKLDAEYWQKHHDALQRANNAREKARAAR